MLNADGLMIQTGTVDTIQMSIQEAVPMDGIGREQRKTPRQAPSRSETVSVTVLDKIGSPTQVAATILDFSDGGIGIVIPVCLTVGSSISVLRNASNGGGSAHGKATRMKVSWCTPAAAGQYRAGLAFEPAAPATPEQEQPPLDHYDVLQLSDKADPDMIHRVYRLLAQRYHPDNQDTGDTTIFRQVSEAYRILSDPERRAAYDLRRRATQKRYWKIFEQPQAVRGMEAEKRQRRGVLALLYTKRMNDPAQPTMTIHELEDLLGCPREHLEFTLWFLKERGSIVRADNGRHAITAKGVEDAEAQPPEWLQEDRLLPAGKA